MQLDTAPNPFLKWCSNVLDTQTNYADLPATRTSRFPFHSGCVFYSRSVHA